jgi:hypothetical protein
VVYVCGDKTVPNFTGLTHSKKCLYGAEFDWQMANVLRPLQSIFKKSKFLTLPNAKYVAHFKAPYIFRISQSLSEYILGIQIATVLFLFTAHLIEPRLTAFSSYWLSMLLVHTAAKRFHLPLLFKTHGLKCSI